VRLLVIVASCVLVLLVAGGILFCLLRSVLCQDKITAEKEAPGSYRRALVIESNCGPTTSFATSVQVESFPWTVLPVLRPLLFLHADAMVVNGRPRVLVEWVSPTNLQITVFDVWKESLDKQETSLDGVTIDYKFPDDGRQ